MGEKNKTRKLRNLINIASDKFGGVNKGSKILMKIAAIGLIVFLISALVLSILYITDILRFHKQIQIIEWLVLYSVKSWAILISGAIILDILISKLR